MRCRRPRKLRICRRWLRRPSYHFLPHSDTENVAGNIELSTYLRIGKGKKEYLYSVIYILCISQSAHAWITQFYLQMHHACLSFVSVHQMAPPLTEVGDIHLQLTTHLTIHQNLKYALSFHAEFIAVHIWEFRVHDRLATSGQDHFIGRRWTRGWHGWQPTTHPDNVVVYESVGVGNKL